MPMLRNFDQESPIHTAKKHLDYKSIDVMLKYLKEYPLDHHSKEINDIIPYLIDKGLPELPNYLEHRMIQTVQIKQILKAQLKSNYEEVMPLQLWYNKSYFKERLIDEAEVEKRIKCEYIDLPDVYHYQDP